MWVAVFFEDATHAHKMYVTHLPISTSLSSSVSRVTVSALLNGVVQSTLDLDLCA